MGEGLCVWRVCLREREEGEGRETEREGEREGGREDREKKRERTQRNYCRMIVYYVL